MDTNNNNNNRYNDTATIETKWFYSPIYEIIRDKPRPQQLQLALTSPLSPSLSYQWSTTSITSEIDDDGGGGGDASDNGGANVIHDHKYEIIDNFDDESWCCRRFCHHHRNSSSRRRHQNWIAWITITVLLLLLTFLVFYCYFVRCYCSTSSSLTSSNISLVQWSQSSSQTLPPSPMTTTTTTTTTTMMMMMKKDIKDILNTTSRTIVNLTPTTTTTTPTTTTTTTETVDNWHQSSTSPSPQINNDDHLTDGERQKYIRSLTLKLWNSVWNKAVNSSKKKNHINLYLTSSPPLSSSLQWHTKTGRTLLSSLTTLIVVRLNQQFKQLYQWILSSNFRANSNIDHQPRHDSTIVNVYQIVQQCIGSLLSTYAMIQSEAYQNEYNNVNAGILIKRAKTIASQLTPAYDDDRLPFRCIKIKIKYQNSSIPSMQPKFINTLSEVGGQYLQYKYLNDLLTNWWQSSAMIDDVEDYDENLPPPPPPSGEEDNYYQKRVQLINDRLYRLAQFSSHTGLYGSKVNINTSEWIRDDDNQTFADWIASPFNKHDATFFQTLIKSFLQSGGGGGGGGGRVHNDDNGQMLVSPMKQFQHAIQSYEDVHGQAYDHSRSSRIMQSSAPSSSSFGAIYATYSFALFVASTLQSSPSPSPSSPSSPSSYKLWDTFVLRERSKRYRTLAQRFTKMNHDYQQNLVESNKKHTYACKNAYQLATSYFMLHRTMGYYYGDGDGGDDRYKRYAWQLASIIPKCDWWKRFVQRMSNGDNDDDDCDDDNDDISIHLSGTLKYLYLIFASPLPDMKNLPLSQWVYTERGHPLPICGHNNVYPWSMCGGSEQ